MEAQFATGSPSRYKSERAASRQRVRAFKLLRLHTDDLALVLERDIQIAVRALFTSTEPSGGRRPGEVGLRGRQPIGTDLQQIQAVAHRSTVNADAGKADHHLAVPVLPLRARQECVAEQALRLPL